MNSSSTDPTRNQLLSFGVTIALALVLIGAVKGHRMGETVTVDLLIAAGALFALACVVMPSVMSPLYRGWMRLAEGLGWINTRILLVVIFYLVVTPLGLLMRLFKRDPLDMARRDSYWTEPSASSYGERHFEKQF